LFVGKNYVLDIEGDGSIVLQEQYYAKDIPIDHDGDTLPVDNHVSFSLFNTSLEPDHFIENCQLLLVSLSLILFPFQNLIDNLLSDSLHIASSRVLSVIFPTQSFCIRSTAVLII